MPKAFTALRRYAALKSIPLLHQTAQLLGRLGTAMPGEVALKIYPSLLADLCQGQAVSLVTGTNGKSSVSALLAQMLRESGLSVIHNAGGANMASGLVTALGLQSKDLAQDQAKLVFEIDEAWFAKLAPTLKPTCLVVTNLFRDQVDRNGDVLAVREKLAQGIRLALKEQPHLQLILNADDPYVASLATEVQDPAPLFFALDWLEDDSQNQVNAEQAKGQKAYACPLCGSDLTYQQRSYDHVGLYHCPACGFSRPQPDLSLKSSSKVGLYQMTYQGQTSQLDLGTKQDYVLYNLAAASLAALHQGADLAHVLEAGQRQESLAGRDQVLALNQERQAQIRLVKNPVGLSLGLKALASDPDARGLCLMINNQESDGRDISWLKEVDYQPLLACASRLDFILLSGSQASVLAEILQERGIPADRLRLEPQVGEAWQQAQALLTPGHKLFILPNYTAMWELQGLLKKTGTL